MKVKGLIFALSLFGFVQYIVASTNYAYETVTEIENQQLVNNSRCWDFQCDFKEADYYEEIDGIQEKLNLKGSMLLDRFDNPKIKRKQIIVANSYGTIKTKTNIVYQKGKFGKAEFTFRSLGGVNITDGTQYQGFTLCVKPKKRAALKKLNPVFSCVSYPKQ